MQAKRSLLVTYLRTSGTPENPTWSLIGDGVTTLSISYEPESEDLQYINHDTATTALKRYKPTMSLDGVLEITETGEAVKSYELNPVFSYINDLRRTRSITNENESEILIVELYTGSFDTINNVWTGCKSQRQKVNIQVNEFGGDAGDTISFSSTVNFSGDPSDSVSTYSVSNSSERILIDENNSYTVSYTATNITHANQPTAAYKGLNLRITLTPESGYILPDTVTITVGGSTISQGTKSDYTWNKNTGVIVIKGEKITGDVSITATATKVTTATTSTGESA